MKLFVVCFALIAVAAAAVSPYHVDKEVYVKQGAYEPSKVAKIIQYENDASVEGYKFSVKTSDGQEREEQAIVENPGTDDEALSVVGRFLYPGLKGEIIEVQYVADKDGFRPQGAHLPQPVQPVH